MATATSRITRNFQVTLPKEIRETEHLRVGDEVVFIVGDDHRVQLFKRDEDIMRKAAGLWKGVRETGPEYVRKLRQEWHKREQT